MSSRIPLLLITSLLCTKSLWQSQINHLKNIADCIVPDTTKHDSIPAIVHDILKNAPPQFALAGLSMGGYVSLEIMRQAPQRVLKLGMLNTSARADTPQQNEQRRISIAASRIGQFKGVTPRLLPTLIHPDRVNDTGLTDLIVGMATEMGRDVFYNQQTAIMNRPDSRELLKTITCPTLVIGGAQDAITPPEVMKEIADGIKGAQFHLIDHCGHLSAIERPETVNTLMQHWLEAA